MKILIKQARIVDPLSPYNGQVTDILVENSIIQKIGNSLTDSADEHIQAPNLCVSPGWVDTFSNFADPGYEYKETLESGCEAAAAGGYTDVFLIPNTSPVVHNKAGVEYLVRKSKPGIVNIHPIAAITKNAEGKELAEMYDMKKSGAIAFSDGLNSVQSAGLLVKALQYVKAFDGIVIQLPDDKTINPAGLVNEGIISTSLGLPGKPTIAEELMIVRDISLAEYAASKIHFTSVSAKKSVEHIRDAKQAGINVTCSVTPYHLYFTDEDIQQYDTNLKLNNPLRTKKDQDVLKSAIKDGTVDCIATHHLPHEYDSKVLEFEYAKYGMIGLETTYAVLNTAMPEIKQETWVSLLSVNPRKIFGLADATIKEGNKASITLFDDKKEWTLTKEMIRSRSANSPFIGKKLTGKPIGIINEEKLYLNHD